jgi:hypothetical protein
MIVPGYLELTAFRHTTFKVQLDFPGVDLTGYDFKMQIRTAPGAVDPALKSLTTVTTNVTGIKNLGYTNGISSITVYITAADMNTTFGALADVAENKTLAYDLVLTPSGGDAYVWLYGPFKLYPGVTV